MAVPVASTPMCEHEWDPYGPAVLITVGQAETAMTWKTSQSMLCFYSTWFRRMCLPDLHFTTVPKEGIPFEIRLPGDDAAAFSMALNYMHTRRFFDFPVTPDGQKIEDGAVLTFEKIIDVYAFGEKRGMPLIMNAAADLMGRKIKYCLQMPDRWATEYLWEKTMSTSKLRKMLVEFVRAIALPYRNRSQIWATLVHGISEDPDRLVYAMEQLQLDGVKVRVSLQTWNRMQACEWHVHEPKVCCELAEEALLDRGRGEDDAEIGLERGGRGPHRV